MSEPVSGPRRVAGREISVEEENRVVSKVLWAVIPLCVAGLFASFVDRTNIAVAGPEMTGPLGLSPTMFGLASGLFFIGYVLFEIPSNLALKRYGAKLWIARIMITWGLVCVGTAWVQGATSLYIMRFLLGVAEAGFYPGILFYLSLFIPARHLTRAYSLFQIGIPISLAVGSVLTASLLKMHGFLGHDGWQWVFIIEGGMAVVLGIVCLYVMASRPEDAKWLNAEDKSTLRELLRRETKEGDDNSHGWTVTKQVICSKKTWLFSTIYIFMMLGFYSVTYWLPQIIKLRLGLTNVEAGLLSAVPWVFATIALIFVSKYTAKHGNRAVLLVGILAFCGLGMMISSLAASAMVAFIGLCMGACIQAAVPLLYSFPSREFTGAHSAVALAFVNSVGNIGGFFGPYILGMLRESTGGDSFGLMLLSSSFFIGALISVSLIRASHRQVQPAE